MIKSLVFLCLIVIGTRATGSFEIWSPGYTDSCPEGAAWSDCRGHCLRTCANPDPPACLLKLCIPGCVCPEGAYRDRFDRCVSKMGCMLRR